MDRYTCITLNRGYTHISQHTTEDPVQSLREHINSLPFIEGINPIGNELHWLQKIATGKTGVTLDLLPDIDKVWSWDEGARYPIPYTTYVILTKT